MLSKAMQDAINKQINHELYSGYLYLSMAAELDAQNLPGAAHWMRVQSEEETGHALKFYHHVYDRGGRVELLGIDQPPAEFGGALAAFQQALEHERRVTELIRGIYALATHENDYATQGFLQWFIQEQVEEEKTATTIVERLRMIGGSGSGLIMLDHHLGERKGQ